LVGREDHFFVDPEASDWVGFDQMVELAGIGYSFGLEIGKFAEEVFVLQVEGSTVDGFLMQFVEGHQQEFPEAFLAVENPSVDERPLLKPHQNHGLQ
jgi:hypothetical protein